MTSSSKTIAFFGASTGIGLSALKHSLAAGHQCVALCRTPSKFTAIFPVESTPNLRLVEGNAHDAVAVSKCLRREDGRLVDAVVTTIGGKFDTSKFTIDDKDVCRKGAVTLVETLADLRRDGATGSPYIIACSSTGISKFGRDIPIAMVPLYHWMLKVPHEDKRALEECLLASQEAFTIVRPSFLTNGESTKEVRDGIEDPKTGRESKAVGYTISREDAGKWIAQNLLLKRDAKYHNKFVMITT